MVPMSKLMTLKQAEQVLEDWDANMESYEICKAEAGMGAVSMGWDGYDGMAVYSSFNPRPNPNDDPEYVEAMAVTKMFYDLRVSEISEFGEHGIVFPDDVVVPEFFPYGEPARDAIPF
jgi:hypothetical protein